jgi:hypothetical protein
MEGLPWRGPLGHYVLVLVLTQEGAETRAGAPFSLAPHRFQNPSRRLGIFSAATLWLWVSLWVCLVLGGDPMVGGTAIGE